jgi:hypothetical protein
MLGRRLNSEIAFQQRWFPTGPFLMLTRETDLGRQRESPSLLSRPGAHDGTSLLLCLQNRAFLLGSRVPFPGPGMGMLQRGYVLIDPPPLFP